METKVCTKCNVEKDVTEFVKWKTKCKTCISEYQREYRQKNKETLKKRKKEWYQKNKESIDKRVREWNINNKERLKKWNKEYYQKNKESINKRHREYKKNNREKLKKIYSDYQRVRRLSDPLFNLKLKIRNRIYNSLNRKGYIKKSRTYEILGCSFEDFKKHIESQFEDWMNWDNYGKYNGEEKYGWDLDHIVPSSSAQCEDDIIKLNHHTNIQPLCSYVNRKVKRDNIDYYKIKKDDDS
tara:strand:+ start:70 stop:789 length:720 start_codon:yes stop_codon:yes gene_type:complete